MGGVFEHPPSISAPIGRWEKRKKRSKARQKMITNIFQSIFRLIQNCGPQAGPKSGQIFEFFAIVKHRFGKPPLSQELTMYYS